MKKVITYLNPFEWVLWIVSLTVITVIFFVFHNENYLELIGCLIGVTSLLFVSKGSLIGQFTTVLFAVFYGIISYTFRYYGEMVTTLGMSAPIAIAGIITWIRHPSKENKSVVEVNKIKWPEIICLGFLSIGVGIGFYYILRYFNTKHLVISTLSVFASFIASYLTMRRSRFYAMSFMLNDICMITLWALASAQDSTYLAMVVTCATFFINDFYGFINWTRLARRQKAASVRIDEKVLGHLEENEITNLDGDMQVGS